MSFSITQAQYETLIARITALELHSNDMAVAQDKFVTNGQVNELSVVTQAQIQNLDQKVEALELRVTSIEEEPLT